MHHFCSTAGTIRLLSQALIASGLFPILAATKTKTVHPDQQYIDALLQHDQRKINEIYQKFAPGLKNYLMSRGCEANQAGDIFQEALVSIFKMASEKEFVLTCPFEAFLLLVCKRKFLNTTKKTGLRVVTTDAEDGYTQVAGDANAPAVELANQMDKENLVMELLGQMGNCKDIILKSLSKQPQDELAAEMGMTYAYFRKRKSNCMGELATLVRNHPTYKSLMP
jgi:DNA-directed RNA polymerase specialized sigma24 family protein